MHNQFIHRTLGLAAIRDVTFVFRGAEGHQTFHSDRDEDVQKEGLVVSPPTAGHHHQKTAYKIILRRVLSVFF